MRHGHLRYLLAGAFHRMAWVEWGPVDGAPVVCVRTTARASGFATCATGVGAIISGTGAVRSPSGGQGGSV